MKVTTKKNQKIVAPYSILDKIFVDKFCTI